MTTQLYSIEEINKVYADRDALLAALERAAIRMMYFEALVDGVNDARATIAKAEGTQDGK